MQRDDTLDSIRTKRETAKRYAERQIDKWITWSFTIKGKVSWKELMEVIEKYNKLK